MRRHLMPEMKEGGVNVTPLIDIVMCLIIFFMLVAKIGVSRSSDQVDLPATIIGQMIKDMSNTLTINVHAGPLQDPQVTVADHEVKLNGPNGASPLIDLLTAFRKANFKDPRVIIRADRDLEYRQLEPVLLAIAKAKIQNTAYETNEPKGQAAAPVAEVTP
jgi:biopolymer transport protein ExbD